MNKRKLKSLYRNYIFDPYFVALILTVALGASVHLAIIINNQ